MTDLFIVNIILTLGDWRLAGTGGSYPMYLMALLTV
jgi:hypothetical protein